MIFEGTKNQFFFGLGLTRAGETIPDIEKCGRLAEFYGVTMDSLIKDDVQLEGQKRHQHRRANTCGVLSQ